MRKNNIKSVEEKYAIIQKYKQGESAIKIATEAGIDRKRIYVWLEKYEKYGLKGLEIQTGKHHNHTNSGIHLRKPKDKIEELQLELLKKEIEIARLKKGYMVKGVGAEKEFVTTFDKNIK